MSGHVGATTQRYTTKMMTTCARSEWVWAERERLHCFYGSSAILGKLRHSAEPNIWYIIFVCIWCKHNKNENIAFGLSNRNLILFITTENIHIYHCHVQYTYLLSPTCIHLNCLPIFKYKIISRHPNNWSPENIYHYEDEICHQSYYICCCISSPLN